MFFIASKLFWLIAAPSNFMILLAALGLVLTRTVWQRLGLWLVGLAVMLLLICGFTPLGALVIYPLEQRFPPMSANIAAPAGIIVLGGGVDEDISSKRGSIELTGLGARMTEGIALARRFPQAKLVYTGGSGHMGGSKITEAAFAQKLWLEDGVPAAQMLFESRSRNTYENAVFTQAMLKPQPRARWILLTSAAHMPRAMGIFRRIGFPVIPDPVDYKTTRPPGLWHPKATASQNLKLVDAGVREWLGLVAYWISGRSNALFPAP